MQINGSCEVSQEKSTTASTGGYALDIWSVWGTPAFTAQQVTDTPSGFANSLKVSITTGAPAPAATDYMLIQHVIEGYRFERQAFGKSTAQPFSMGFYVKAHRPGNYSGVISNPGKNRTYPFSFAISAADAWEFKTVTIPGDVTGTWPGGTALGVIVCFTLMCGTALQGPANAWAGVNYAGVTGTVNGAAANTDTFQITGLIILPGIELPSVDRLPYIMRPFDQEWLACQRYLWMWQGYGLGYRAAVGYCDTSTFCQVDLYLPTLMRITPTFTSNNVQVNGIASTPNGINQSPNNIAHLVFTGTGYPAGTTAQIYTGSGGGFIKLDARM